MGYCPRCGENSSLGSAASADDGRARLPLRIPAESRIVQLSDIGDEGDIEYGGTRFRVRREGDSFLLRPLE